MPRPVSGNGDLAAAAESVAVDSAYDGLGAVLNGVGGRLAEIVEAVDRALRFEAGQVGAGNEGLVAGSGEDDGFHFLGGVGPLEELAQFDPGNGVDGVQLLGTVRREDGNAVISDFQ